MMPKPKRPRNASPRVIDKSVFAKQIARVLEDKELTQIEAAYILRDAPSQLSLIVNEKVDGFSPERLMRILTRLGRDIEFRISKGSGKQGKVRVVVQ